MPERTYSFIETRLPMPLMSATAEPGKLDEAVAHIAAHDADDDADDAEDHKEDTHELGSGHGRHSFSVGSARVTARGTA